MCDLCDDVECRVGHRGPTKAAEAYAAPSAIYRPALTIDGNQWCALYGENLQDGVAGFGDTPAAAMLAFDHAWATCKAGPAV